MVIFHSGSFGPGEGDQDIVRRYGDYNFGGSAFAEFVIIEWPMRRVTI